MDDSKVSLFKIIESLKDQIEKLKKDNEAVTKKMFEYKYEAIKLRKILQGENNDERIN